MENCRGLSFTPWVEFFYSLQGLIVCLAKPTEEQLQQTVSRFCHHISAQNHHFATRPSHAHEVDPTGPDLGLQQDYQVLISQT